jgi:hypothetical protein
MMKAVSVALLISAILLAGSQQAQAAMTISCEKSTITKINLPTSPSGAGTGVLTFSDGRFALLFGTQIGMDDPSDWKTLREGDHVMTCANMKPYTEVTKKRLIVVIDYDANLMFKSIWGPEGA